MNLPIIPWSPIFVAIMVLATAVSLLVAGLVLYVLLRARTRGDALPGQNHGNRNLEILWTVLPAVLVLALFVWTFFDVSSEPTPGAGIPRPPDVIVTGNQYWWKYEYPSGQLHTLGQPIITANELHIPVGQRILVQLEASLVQHDYWIPQLGKKFDMYPGKTNHLWLYAEEPGEYLGVCAEYCGDQHAYMRILAVAQPDGEFQDWIRQFVTSDPPTVPVRQPARLAGDTEPVSPGTTMKQPEPGSPILADPIPDDPAEQRRLALAGKLLFGRNACGSCHAIAGTEWGGQAGPSLTNYSSRRWISTGVMEHTPSNLAIYLKNPQEIKPGIYMPNYRFTDEQVQALTVYLESLK